jgi:hypothetical protein
MLENQATKIKLFSTFDMQIKRNSSEVLMRSGIDIP